MPTVIFRSHNWEERRDSSSRRTSSLPPSSWSGRYRGDDEYLGMVTKQPRYSALPVTSPASWFCFFASALRWRSPSCSGS